VKPSRASQIRGLPSWKAKGAYGKRGKVTVEQKGKRVCLGWGAAEGRLEPTFARGREGC